MRRTLYALGSGFAVYVLVAACAAGGEIVDRSRDTNADPLDDVTAGAAGAIVDGATNPVKDAKADPLPPDVATEKCDKLVDYGPGDDRAFVAEHSYPGKTAQELASVRVVFSPVTTLAGYEQQTGGSAFIRDGSAAVVCGLEVLGQPETTVTFILPH